MNECSHFITQHNISILVFKTLFQRVKHVKEISKVFEFHLSNNNQCNKMVKIKTQANTIQTNRTDRCKNLNMLASPNLIDYTNILNNNSHIQHFRIQNNYMRLHLIVYESIFHPFQPNLSSFVLFYFSFIFIFHFCQQNIKHNEMLNF